MRKAVAVTLLGSNGKTSSFGVFVFDVLPRPGGGLTLTNPEPVAQAPPLEVEGGGFMAELTDPRVKEYEAEWGKKLGLPTFYGMT